MAVPLNSLYRLVAMILYFVILPISSLHHVFDCWPQYTVKAYYDTDYESAEVSIQLRVYFNLCWLDTFTSLVTLDIPHTLTFTSLG